MNNLTEILSILKDPTTNKSIDIVQIISAQTGDRPTIVRKGIAQGQFKINDKPVNKTEIYVPDNATLRFQNTKIQVEPAETRFDKYIRITLEKCFKVDAVENLSTDQKSKFCAFVIEYFIRFGYEIDELTKSHYNEQSLLALEEFYKRYFHKQNERSPRKKELVDRLVETRNQEFEDFARLVKSITNDLYDLESTKLFQDFSRVFNRRGFKFLVRPVIEYEFEPMKIVEKLVKGYRLVSAETDLNARISNRSKANEEYHNIIALNLEHKDDRISKGLRALIIYFKRKSDAAVGFSDTGNVKLSLTPESRTYNLTIKPLFIYGYIKNEGSGIAKNIRISSRSSDIIPLQDIADILAPGDTRKVKFNVENLEQSNTSNLNITVEWENDFNERSVLELSSFEIVKQDDKLPWDDLKRTNPYSLNVVDNPNKLFGRDKLIEDLRWNIENSSSINSYVLYGQKRVGKSSIIRTLDTIYKDDPQVVFIYRTMGDIKNSDANKTFQRLGESIANKMVQDFKRKHKPSQDDIFSLIKPSFVGSLAPLNELIEFICDREPSIKIIIALDEFDELNKEFFENGEIGKTFALNIGKGLNEKPHVGFILIGSETMETKTRQGMRLNSFEIKKVDTFDKQTEFASYCRIITEPTKSCLVFEPAVFNHLFDYTNGNPYYTNILLDKIFREAYEKRIAFIDLDFTTSNVKHLVTSILSRKDFEHFWSDGLSEEAVTHEKVLDRRRRILTAFAITKRENPNLTWNDLRKKLKYPTKYTLTETQLENTLDEFKSRGIIRVNEKSTLEVVPRLFEDWLLGPGVYQVIAQLEDKDEILDKVHQEEKLVLLDEELMEILTHLEGHPSKERVKALRQFLNQFDDNNSKRLIADLLSRFVVIHTSELEDYQNRVRKSIWGNVELGVGDRDLRTDAEIICLSDSYEQNTIFSESLKSSLKFVKNKSIKRTSELNQIDNSVRHLIIFEPLIDCPYYYRNEIALLLKKLNPALVVSTRIHLLCYVITNEAKNELDDYVSRNFAFDFEIHHLKSIERSDICPYLNSVESINDPAWTALSLYHRNSDESSCLVKIGNLTPYQCFPLLWNNVDNFIPLYPSAVPISVYQNRIDISNKLKDFNFSSESNQLEFKASLSEPAPNWKEILKRCKSIKNATISAETSSALKEVERLWALKNPEKELSNVVKHGIAKTLAAFGNTRGGELFVGVEDDLTIQGLSYDMKIHKTEEEVRRAFDRIVENYLGLEHSPLFTLHFIKIGVPVLKIVVSISTKEVGVKIDVKGNKLHQNRAEFYIRGQQESRLLSAQEFFDWKTNRANLSVK